MKIFIVDDDPIYVLLITKAISIVAGTIEVSDFADGQLALNRLFELRHDHEELPDIIFLDLNMPVMDGWEFLSEYVYLKSSLNKNTVIYVVSSSISPSDVERAKRLNVVVDFLIKPLDSGTIAWVTGRIDDR